MAAKIGTLVGSLLAEPATRGMDLDDPATTVQRRRLAKAKRSLYHCNRAWYRRLEQVNATAPDGLRIEIGAGGGFLKEHITDLITTDVLPVPFVDHVCNAEAMPFEDATVGAIFMINVLHHIMHPKRFFEEAGRVLVPGGVAAMIEPAVTPFSKIIYRHFHPEPFEPEAASWDLEPSGPLSGGNDANPWIIFVRDRAQFDARYPGLVVDSIDDHTSLSRLLCGGVLMRSLMPSFLFPPLIYCENRAPTWLMKRVALFMTVVVRKRKRYD